MLQQTKASVVERYFPLWMSRFPCIRELALASQEEVIKAWEGLGYYSRARNLHLAAKYILEKHGGIIPDKKEELQKIKGLGPYTVGALLSFAFHQKSAAIDANVTRVLARYYGIEEDVTKANTKHLMQTIVEGILPDIEPWVCMEGLIELGATICSRVAECVKCPIQAGCKARELSNQHMLPKKPHKKKCRLLTRSVIVLVYQNSLLLKETRPKGLMADLYEFPYFEQENPREPLLQFLSKQAVCKHPLTAVVHTFTHFRVTLVPSLWCALSKEVFSGYKWVLQEDLTKLPFSSGHRKILQQVLKSAI